MENGIYLKTCVCNLANATVRCDEGQKFLLVRPNRELVYGGGSRLNGVGLIKKDELCCLIGRVNCSNDILVYHDGSELRFSSLWFDYYDSDQLVKAPEPEPELNEGILLLVEEKIDRFKQEILDLLKGGLK